MDRYKTSKPATRWWWFADFIQKEDISFQLDWLRDNGFGGVEIAWVYPLPDSKPAQAWLSPELNSSEDMIRLAKRLRGMQYPCLNMSFHSTSLLAGMSPFVQDSADEEKFIEKIEKFLIFSVEAGFQPVTLSQAC